MGQLQHIQHQIAALNDLIMVNNESVSGYEKALERTADAEPQKVFQQFREQGRQDRLVLKEVIHRLGGESTAVTTVFWKFYRIWLNIKSKYRG